MSSLTGFCIVEKLIFLRLYIHACINIQVYILWYRLLINHLFRQEQNFSVLLPMFGKASLGGLALTTGFESTIN